MLNKFHRAGVITRNTGYKGLRPVDRHIDQKTFQLSKQTGDLTSRNAGLEHKFSTTNNIISEMISFSHICVGYNKYHMKISHYTSRQNN